MPFELPVAGHGARDGVKIAITFDDGPNPFATPKVLEILKEFDCPATFFLIGKWVLAYPELVRQIVQEGHSIGGHSFSHILKSDKNLNIIFDFEDGNKAIQSVTGGVPQFIRVPGFQYTETNQNGTLKIQELISGRVGESVAKGAIKIIGQDAGSGDWAGISAKEIQDNVLRRTKSGSIILFHDGSENPAKFLTRPANMLKALPKILDMLKKKGFEFVTLDKLPLVFKPRVIAQPKVDYLVKLYDLPGYEKLEMQLRESRISVRRALAPEKQTVMQWVEQHFNRGWAAECDIAFYRQPIACFIATKGKQIVGFGCYEATCKGFTGPRGVHPKFRKQGIGKLIMLKSLHAMRHEGHAYAITGSGINNYFEQTIGAMRIEGSTGGFYKGILPA